MGEVGERGPEFHREVGAYAHERGVDALFAVGPLTREAAQTFGANAVHFDDINALIATLRRSLQAGTTVLVKGSRFMQMERVVHALTAQPMAIH